MLSAVRRVSLILPCLVVTAASASADVQYTIHVLGAIGSADSLLINSKGDVLFGRSLYVAGNVQTLTFAAPIDRINSFNDSDQIVGTYYSNETNQIYHAFLYSGGTLTDLGSMDGVNGYSAAAGISDAGQIAGWSSGSGQPWRAATFNGGSITDLGPLLGDGTSIATAISRNGAITGWAAPPGSASHLFLYMNGQVTDLGAPGPSTGSFNPIGVNDSGQVIGYLGSSYPYSTASSYIYDNGQYHDLGTLGGTDTRAGSINNAGQVVGMSYPSSGIGHAFLYNDGTMTDLNTLIGPHDGYQLTNATGINDSGQIVAVALINGQSSYEAMLLTPVPEPASLSLLTLAAGGLLVRRRTSDRVQAI